MEGKIIDTMHIYIDFRDLSWRVNKNLLGGLVQLYRGMGWFCIHS